MARRRLKGKTAGSRVPLLLSSLSQNPTPNIDGDTGRRELYEYAVSTIKVSKGLVQSNASLLQERLFNDATALPEDEQLQSFTANIFRLLGNRDFDIRTQFAVRIFMSTRISECLMLWIVCLCRPRADSYALFNGPRRSAHIQRHTRPRLHYDKRESSFESHRRLDSTSCAVTQFSN